MDFLKIGFIKKPRGLKGELKILPLTDDCNRFKKLKSVYVLFNGEYVIKELEFAKTSNDEVILKFKGLDKVEEVEVFRNSYIFIEKKEGVKLGDWEYYSQDLIGCDVSFEGNTIGKVVDVENFGANDNLLVSCNDGEFFFPFSRLYVNKVDVEGRSIEINQVEGFFE